jgi:chromosome segregation ATPase
MDMPVPIGDARVMNVVNPLRNVAPIAAPPGNLNVVPGTENVMDIPAAFNVVPFFQVDNNPFTPFFNRQRPIMEAGSPLAVQEEAQRARTAFLMASSGTIPVTDRPPMFMPAVINQQAAQHALAMENNGLVFQQRMQQGEPWNERVRRIQEGHRNIVEGSRRLRQRLDIDTSTPSQLLAPYVVPREEPLLVHDPLRFEFPTPNERTVNVSVWPRPRQVVPSYIMQIPEEEGIVNMHGLTAPMKVRPLALTEGVSNSDPGLAALQQKALVAHTPLRVMPTMSDAQTDTVGVISELQDMGVDTSDLVPGRHDMSTDTPENDQQRLEALQEFAELKRDLESERARLVAANRNVDSLNARIARVTAYIARLESELAQSKGSIEELNATIDDLRQENAELMSISDEFEQLADRTAAEIDRLTAENATAMAAAATVSSEQKEEQLARFNIEKGRLEAQLEQLSVQLTDVAATAHARLEENNTLMRRMQEMDATNASTLKAKNELSRQLVDQSKAYSKVEAQKQRLEGLLKQKTVANYDLEIRLQAAEQRFVDAQKAGSTRQELDRLNKELRDVTAEKSRLEQANDQLSDDKGKQDVNLAEQRRKIGELQVQLAQAQTNGEQGVERIRQELTRELNAVKAQLAAQTATAQDQGTQIATLSSNLQRAQQDLAAESTRHNSTRMLLQEAQSNLAAQEQQSQELNSELNALRQQLAAKNREVEQIQQQSEQLLTEAEQRRQSEGEQLRDQLEELTVNLETLQGTVAQKEQQLAQQQAAAEEQRQELESMRGRQDQETNAAIALAQQTARQDAEARAQALVQEEVAKAAMIIQESQRAAQQHAAEIVAAAQQQATQQQALLTAEAARLRQEAEQEIARARQNGESRVQAVQLERQRLEEEAKRSLDLATAAENDKQRLQAQLAQIQQSASAQLAQAQEENTARLRQAEQALEQQRAATSQQAAAAAQAQQNAAQLQKTAQSQAQELEQVKQSAVQAREQSAAQLQAVTDGANQRVQEAHQQLAVASQQHEQAMSEMEKNLEAAKAQVLAESAQRTAQMERLEQLNTVMVEKDALLTQMRTQNGTLEGDINSLRAQITALTTQVQQGQISEHQAQDEISVLQATIAAMSKEHERTVSSLTTASATTSSQMNEMARHNEDIVRNLRSQIRRLESELEQQKQTTTRLMASESEANQQQTAAAVSNLTADAATAPAGDVRDQILEDLGAATIAQFSPATGVVQQAPVPVSLFSAAPIQAAPSLPGAEHFTFTTVRPQRNPKPIERLLNTQSFKKPRVPNQSELNARENSRKMKLQQQQLQAEAEDEAEAAPMAEEVESRPTRTTRPPDYFVQSDMQDFARPTRKRPQPRADSTANQAAQHEQAAEAVTQVEPVMEEPAEATAPRRSSRSSRQPQLFQPEGWSHRSPTRAEVMAREKYPTRTPRQRTRGERTEDKSKMRATQSDNPLRPSARLVASETNTGALQANSTRTPISRGVYNAQNAEAMAIRASTIAASVNSGMAPVYMPDVAGASEHTGRVDIQTGGTPFEASTAMQVTTGAQQRPQSPEPDALLVTAESPEDAEQVAQITASRSAAAQQEKEYDTQQIPEQVMSRMKEARLQELMDISNEALTQTVNDISKIPDPSKLDQVSQAYAEALKQSNSNPVELMQVIKDKGNPHKATSEGMRLLYDLFSNNLRVMVMRTPLDDKDKQVHVPHGATRRARRAPLVTV